MVKKIISGFTAAAMLVSTMQQLSIANAASSAANIIINEVCTQNKACLIDSYGESSDWIELYNASDKEVSLAGYSVSKAPEKPKTWVFPDDAVIGAGEYIVLIASKNESVKGEYHLGFNLSKNGETLTLKAPDGSIVHELDVPTLGEDVTYGITYTGNAEIMEPTPMKLNEAVVSAPSFSEPSGFYAKNFKLSLSASKGDTIYYTTDGSDPMTSPTAEIYKGSFLVKDRSDQDNVYRTYGGKYGDPLSICVDYDYDPPTVPVDKAMVVRAAAKNDDGVFSDVVQQTYFVTDGALADYTDMTVVSLVTDPDNLFSADKGIYVVGDRWDWCTEVDEDSDIINFQGKGKKWEREANMTVFENGKNIIEQNIGLRIKGSSSRNYILKSFNLFARSEYGASKIKYPIFPDNTDVNGNLITEYDSISLRSGAGHGAGNNINDTICHKLMEDRENISTAAKRSCILFLNGEYWGIYEFAERLSDEYVNKHYGVKKSNILITKNWKSEVGSDEENQEFYDNAYKYAAMDMSNDSNYKEVCRYYDVDSIIEHYAAGIYFGTWDWPDYNFAAWKDKTEDADNRWHFMSYDFDYTLGSTYEDIDYKLYSSNWFEKVENNSGCASTALFLSLLKNKEFRLKFAKAFKKYADNDKALDIAKSIGEARIYEWVKNRFFTYSSTIMKEVDNAEAGKKLAEEQIRSEVLDMTYEFLEKRPEYALSHMYNYLNISPSELEESDEAAPSTDDIKYEAADLVMLSKYLLGNGKLENWKKYDLCKDDRIDVYDMCLLRKRVTEDTEIQPNLVDPNYIVWHAAEEEGASAEITQTEGEGFIANVSESGSETWSIQVKCKKLNIEKGSKYQVSFDYIADKQLPISVYVDKGSDDYYIYHNMEFTADKKLQHYSEIFTMTEETNNSARLAFNLGGVENVPYTLTVTNIRVEKIS